ncbi:hypothetical protein C6I21_04260 [Alkalicoccus urumqiensis]|uniref:Proline reductase n=1 Tax=Alkalicoccus urumqiensis TaxID=1548213 RepID=A0A2P6MJV8_ALKUR|nr:glycine/sarcosine/betaine reductase selenoprotein B family protein [Alkalicoccus urumqiensis]PRO66564.1 hypothetical protein C6I21_04260 [Alkalicoccus urumqiensis]
MFSRMKDQINQWIARRSIKKHGKSRVSSLTTAVPPEQARISFLTTAGVHLKEDPPFDVDAGDWGVRRIPAGSRTEDLMVTHTHYDTEAAEEDVNTVFPISVLQKLENEGAVGSLAPTLFGMMGYIPRTDKLMNESIPDILSVLKEEKVDILLLSPG